MWLRAALKRLFLEAFYIGAATVVLVLLYQVGAGWWRSPDDYSYINQIMNHLRDYPPMAVGKPLSVRDGSLGRGSYALFVIVSPTCQFCRDSAAFNERLAAEGAKSHFVVAFGVPKVAESRTYRSRFGIKKATVVDWENLTARASGTPTVILVGPDGIVRRIWQGRLSPMGEVEVLNALRDPASVRSPDRFLNSGERMLRPEELQPQVLKTSYRIVNVSNRRLFRKQQAADEVNIPLGELAVRATFELKRSELTVVDCTFEPDPVCNAAIRLLRTGGYDAVALDAAAQLPTSR